MSSAERKSADTELLKLAGQVKKIQRAFDLRDISTAFSDLDSAKKTLKKICDHKKTQGCRGEKRRLINEARSSLLQAYLNQAKRIDAQYIHQSSPEYLQRKAEFVSCIEACKIAPSLFDHLHQVFIHADNSLWFDYLKLVVQSASELILLKKKEKAEKTIEFVKKTVRSFEGIQKKFVGKVLQDHIFNDPTALSEQEKIRLDSQRIRVKVFKAKLEEIKNNVDLFSFDQEEKVKMAPSIEGRLQEIKALLAPHLNKGSGKGARLDSVAIDNKMVLIEKMIRQRVGNCQSNNQLFIYKMRICGLTAIHRFLSTENQAGHQDIVLAISHIVVLGSNSFKQLVESSSDVLARALSSILLLIDRRCLERKVSAKDSYREVDRFLNRAFKGIQSTFQRKTIERKLYRRIKFKALMSTALILVAVNRVDSARHYLKLLNNMTLNASVERQDLIKLKIEMFNQLCRSAATLRSSSLDVAQHRIELALMFREDLASSLDGAIGEDLLIDHMVAIWKAIDFLILEKDILKSEELLETLPGIIDLLKPTKENRKRLTKEMNQRKKLIADLRESKRDEQVVEVKKMLLSEDPATCRMGLDRLSKLKTSKKKYISLGLVLPRIRAIQTFSGLAQMPGVKVKKLNDIIEFCQSVSAQRANKGDVAVDEKIVLDILHNNILSRIQLYQLLKDKKPQSKRYKKVLKKIRALIAKLPVDKQAYFETLINGKKEVKDKDANDKILPEISGGCLASKNKQSKLGDRDEAKRKDVPSKAHVEKAIEVDLAVQDKGANDKALSEINGGCLASKNKQSKPGDREEAKCKDLSSKVHVEKMIEVDLAVKDRGSNERASLEIKDVCLAAKKKQSKSGDRDKAKCKDVPSKAHVEKTIGVDLAAKGRGSNEKTSPEVSDDCPASESEKLKSSGENKDECKDVSSYVEFKDKQRSDFLVGQLSVNARRIMDLLLKAGAKVYIVGGLTRLAFTGKATYDVDLVTTLPKNELTKIILSDEHFKLKSPQLTIPKKKNIAYLSVDSESFDICFIADDKKKTLIVDAKRRDYTVNGLYLAYHKDSNDNFFIDCVNARRDCHINRDNGYRVRLISAALHATPVTFQDNHTYLSDPLRMFRALHHVSPRVVFDQATLDQIAFYSKVAFNPQVVMAESKQRSTQVALPSRATLLGEFNKIFVKSESPAFGLYYLNQFPWLLGVLIPIAEQVASIKFSKLVCRQLQAELSRYISSHHGAQSSPHISYLQRSQDCKNFQAHMFASLIFHAVGTIGMTAGSLKSTLERMFPKHLERHTFDSSVTYGELKRHISEIIQDRCQRMTQFKQRQNASQIFQPATMRRQVSPLIEVIAPVADLGTPT